MECFAKKADTDNFQPLNYQNLKIAQEKDKTIQKILKMPNTICSQGLPWGRKSYQTSLLQREDCNTRTVTKTKIPKIRKMIVKCPLCQRNKRRQKKYGLLPPKLAEATPWDKLCIELIGPYTIQRKGVKDLICRCVTK
jgi:hypothetical protein